MRQHLALLVDNKPGVLTHVAGLISRRGINIEAINAGYTEDADITRINIIVEVKDHWELDQPAGEINQCHQNRHPRQQALCQLRPGPDQNPVHHGQGPD